MFEKLLIRRAAVLGAGVMGAQIAAHMTNAGIDTVLFDLAADGASPDARNAVATKAITNLGKLSPAPLASKPFGDLITPANYDDGLDLLRGCDLIVEAIAERIDWKQALYRRIAPFVHPMLSWPATPRAWVSTRWPTYCQKNCAIASAACISSIHHATCTWRS